MGFPILTLITASGHMGRAKFAVLASIMSNAKASNTIDDDIMTAAELAILLRCHVVTVRLSAAAGKLPGRQIGNRWRFSRRAVLASLSERPEDDPK